MNALNRDFDAMTSDLFDQFADPCTVVRGAADPVTARCVVEDGIESIGQYGQVVGNVTHVSFIKTEWDPQRGDVVTLDGNARNIESIDSDDGLVVKAVLHG